MSLVTEMENLSAGARRELHELAADAGKIILEGWRIEHNGMAYIRAHWISLLVAALAGGIVGWLI